MFSKSIAFISTWFTRAMTEPEINSRIVYLFSGVGSMVAVLALVAAFIFSHDKTGYDYMVVAVSGGAVGHGINRYLNKGKTGGDGKEEKEEAPSAS